MKEIKWGIVSEATNGHFLKASDHRENFPLELQSM